MVGQVTAEPMQVEIARKVFRDHRVPAPHFKMPAHSGKMLWLHAGIVNNSGDKLNIKTGEDCYYEGPKLDGGKRAIPALWHSTRLGDGGWAGLYPGGYGDFSRFRAENQDAVLGVGQSG